MRGFLVVLFTAAMVALAACSADRSDPAAAPYTNLVSPDAQFGAGGGGGAGGAGGM